jgi:AcrR family transcriptional regulator
VFPTVANAQPSQSETGLPRSLPRGPHRLAREVVAASQRGRLLEAMAEAVADKGYAATTVADVVSRAGVSRKTFYEHFRDKEGCFLAAYDTGVEVLLGELASRAEAAGPEAGWRERVRGGIHAYLEVLASEPAFAHTFLVEVTAAGPRARERRDEVHRRFVELLRGQVALARADHPELPEVPEPVYAAIVGGINEVVSSWVREGRTAYLLELEPALTYFQLALLAGPKIAKEAVA